MTGSDVQNWEGEEDGVETCNGVMAQGIHFILEVCIQLTNYYWKTTMGWVIFKSRSWLRACIQIKELTPSTIKPLHTTGCRDDPMIDTYSSILMLTCNTKIIQWVFTPLLSYTWCHSGYQNNVTFREHFHSVLIAFIINALVSTNHFRLFPWRANIHSWITWLKYVGMSAEIHCLLVLVT